MRHLDIVRIPARLSRIGTTEIYYEYVDDDWHERAERLQSRRWHKIHIASEHANSQKHHWEERS